jgi:hypothetical protein
MIKRSGIGAMVGLCGLLIVTGCKRCEQSELASLAFTPPEMKINPYSGKEVLTFISLGGDTIVFPAGTRSLLQDQYFRYDYETAKLDHNGCQGDYYYTQQDYTGRWDSIHKSYFALRLGFLYTIARPMAGMYFDMFFSTGNPDSYGFDGDFCFETDTLLNRSGSNDSIRKFHPLLAIGPRSFEKVYELYGYNYKEKTKEGIPFAYYTIKEGLVGFLTNKGETWYLDKVSRNSKESETR